MWIAPNYQDTDFRWPLTIEDKISIFEDRTIGWQLGLANRVINGSQESRGQVDASAIPHSGYAFLHIVLSYFEMIAKFRDGYARQGRSDHYFKQGAYAVFSELQNHPQHAVEELLSALYGGGRCSLYHGGIADSTIVLTGELNAAMAFDAQNGKLIINPHRLAPALIAHFRSYIRKLREPGSTELRAKFEKRFDYEGH